MITQAASISAGQTLTADVCVVGAGPAGLTVAQTLAARGMQVLLLESGGFQADLQADALNIATVIPPPPSGDVDGAYENPAIIRARRFGGTSSLWNTPVADGMGAKFVPLDPLDFEQRDWIPHSGWPFDRTALDQFYAKAHSFCGLGPFRYDTDFWQEAPIQLWPLPSDALSCGIYQLGPGDRFGDGARQAIAASANLQCVLNATVTQINLDPSGDCVSNLTVASVSNSVRFSVAASKFVLAAGTFENARLLLESDQLQTGGIGNQHDMVGRGLMDHPVFHFTQLTPSSRQLFEKSGFFDLKLVRGIPVLGRLLLTPETLRRERLLSASVVLYPRPAGYRSRGIEALRRIRIHLRQKKIPPQLLNGLRDLVIGTPDLLAYAARSARGHTSVNHGWSELPNPAERFETFEPEFYLEQAPDMDNRVVLGSQRDSLGMRRLEIHWRWDSLSRRSVHRTVEIMALELQRLGIGRLDILDARRFRPSAHHPAGTTRMHTDPRQGVVDENCRVHGVGNLYAAGPSIFPTAGFANPMLSTVALAIRLAEHLSPT